MPLYKPGKQEPKGRGERSRRGGFSAMPLGRIYYMVSELGSVYIDKVRAPGREEFAEEVEEARQQGIYSERELELLERYGNLESGEAVWLCWRLNVSRTTIRTDLSRCTEEELDAFKDAMLRAVEEARPEVQRRDSEAQRAEQEGFYNLYRITRSSPQVTDLGRKKSQHNQELHE